MKKAFSLVELSIVIIIIGLLVAGVSAGDKLVTQAKLRKSISQINEIQTAVRTFYLSYDSLPGDMSNASTFWSSAANGDGDDIMDGSEISTNWYKHLEFAKLIGGYNKDSSGRAMLSFVAWSVIFDDDDRSAEYTTQNLFIIKDHAGSGSVKTTGANLYNIDKKIDDGKPYAGTVMGTTDSSSCSSAGVLSSANCCANYYSISNASFAAATAAGKVYQQDSLTCGTMYIEPDL